MTTNPSIRIESDSMGELEVQADRYWGAQTQRSLGNFKIGGQKMPEPLVRALGIQKLAAAKTNTPWVYCQMTLHLLSSRQRKKSPAVN